MLLKSLLYKILGLILALWATASVLFFINHALPSFSSPLGMGEADISLYGNSSTAIRQHIKNEFLKRRGLAKPIFYLKVQPYGYWRGEQLRFSNTLEALPAKATLWHGQEPTKAFLKEWSYLTRQLDTATADTLQLARFRTSLLAWANEPSPIVRQKLAVQFSHDLHETGQKRLIPLAATWQKLQSGSSPVWYYLPSSKWVGKDNQYHIWLKGVLAGNLGLSFKDYSPVKDKVMASLKVSLAIVLPGLVLAILFSFLLGFWLSLPLKSMAKNIVKQILYMLDSLPGFIITLSIFALHLSLGGTLSYVTQGENFTVTQTSLLASLCVSLFLLPYLTLYFHQNLQEESGKLYLRTAQAKGLSFPIALMKHAIPNALSSIFIVVADILASLIAGVLIVEITFSIPGTGSLLAQSLLTQDYPTVIGLTLGLLFLRIVIMWLAEIGNCLVDPRRRLT